MNAENGAELVAKLPKGAAKFFECNVLETESVAAAVSGAVDWIRETGKPLGGVVPAAGVSTPATVGQPPFLSFALPRSILRSERGIARRYKP